MELFSKLTVSKTAGAHTIEDGIAGSVNIVNVRPFDNLETGFHLSCSFQDQHVESGGSFSPRGAIIASENWGNTFGILIGLAGQYLKYRTDGYENVGDDIVGITDQEAAFGPARVPSIDLRAQHNRVQEFSLGVGSSARAQRSHCCSIRSWRGGNAIQLCRTRLRAPCSTSGLSIQ